MFSINTTKSINILLKCVYYISMQQLLTSDHKLSDHLIININ